MQKRFYAETVLKILIKIRYDIFKSNLYAVWKFQDRIF